MGRHSHLRVVPSLPAPAVEQRSAAARPREGRGTDPRTADQLRARTRASLDGFTVDDIATLAAAIRAQLHGHARRTADGSATAAAAAAATALRTALAAHDEVLAWLVDTDTSVYHGQLR
ncbi:hypothetical protein SAMN05216207_106020 [Pseudonocardia ammonioxydans]|uniref:Uncharacterized protein n=1 Tax=Pseudonocardia ammonioxydans TaxID=260086 RepID=A0A1I5H9Q7_PSUAM|nr:hypothetical protein [Pseudonocardia ammonioxydans]SFO44937.1 hypothetical protein SAMN05216207_106020 [Pseudonocardia ammonioxydans]